MASNVTHTLCQSLRKHCQSLCATLSTYWLLLLSVLRDSNTCYNITPISQRAGLASCNSWNMSMVISIVR